MFIVIETSNHLLPFIVCNEEGQPLLYWRKEEAEQEAEYWTKGVVVEL
jgi:hypothetical protein